MTTGPAEGDERAAAVRHADIAAAGWRATVAAQEQAQTDHAEVYAVLGDVAATLPRLDALAARLGVQLGRYVDDVEGGRTHYGRTGRVFDDAGADPRERLDAAVEHLAEARAALSSATSAVNLAWSAVGHVGVDLDAPDSGRQDS